jgi:pre-mRNA-splicing factor SYF1
MDDVRCAWNVPHESALRVLRRFAHYYNPTARELLADVALEFGRYGEAAVLYCEILNDMDFLSASGTTRHDLWIKFTDVCTEHPEETRQSGVDFEGIVRGVLKVDQGEGKEGVYGQWKVFDDTDKDGDGETGAEEVERQEKIREQQAQLQATLGELEGTLWNKLALYYIRSGDFEVARSIYEEAMERVSRVRDFSLIFDSYVNFEENVIEVMMENMNDDEDLDEDTSNERTTSATGPIDEEDLDILLGKRVTNDSSDAEDISTSADIELAIARAENLMKRRPLLLNHVLLKQNPQNIAEWLKRANLYLEADQPSQAISSLEDGMKKVSPKLAMNGSPADLYIKLASLFEHRLADYAKARSVFERVCCPVPEYHFRDSDDLAKCYSSWVEMELRFENWDQALSVARRSVARPSAGAPRAVRGLVKSLRLWNLLLDLEES